MLSFKDFYGNITVPVYQEEEYLGTLKFEIIDEDVFEEAEYRGRKVKLNKPMRGDVKKFKVYVKDPKTGNVRKETSGQGVTTPSRRGKKRRRIKSLTPNDVSHSELDIIV